MSDILSYILIYFNATVYLPNILQLFTLVFYYVFEVPLLGVILNKANYSICPSLREKL